MSGPSGTAPSSTTPTRLSVVMPTYNEEGNLEQAVADVVAHVFPVEVLTELLIVNDGSSDRTGELADRLAAKEPRIRVIHQANAGHGAALRRGIEESRGENLLLLDSDCEIGLEPFATAWREVLSGSSVLGFREQRRDGAVRRVVTLGLRLLIGALFGVTVRDANCPFKLVPRARWRAAGRWIGPDTLAPSALLAVYLCAGRGPVRQLAVPHRVRPTGRSMLHPWRLVTYSLATFQEMVRFRLTRSRWARQES